MAPTRSQIGSFLISLALHVGVIVLASGVAYTVAELRRPIPVALLPGGGGGAGEGREVEGAAVEASAPSAAAAVPAPAAPRVPAKAVRAAPRAKAAAARPARREKRPPRSRELASVAPPASGGTGTGSGPGEGSGSGGGVGGGRGAGAGAGQGAGRALDMRLYCVSCPEPAYPRLARARGWQGAADVELTVLADGRVDGVELGRSSGFDVLDRAALEVARQSRFAPPPEALEPPVRGRLAYRFELRQR